MIGTQHAAFSSTFTPSPNFYAPLRGSDPDTPAPAAPPKPAFHLSPPQDGAETRSKGDSRNNHPGQSNCCPNSAATPAKINRVTGTPGMAVGPAVGPDPGPDPVLAHGPADVTVDSADVTADTGGTAVGGDRRVRVQPPGTSTAPGPNYYDVLAEGALPSSAPEAGMLLPSPKPKAGRPAKPPSSTPGMVPSSEPEAGMMPPAS